MKAITSLQEERPVACRSRNSQSLNYSGRLVAALACKKKLYDKFSDNNTDEQ